MQYWLVVVDTTQIQTYIFGSNRLAENIGASWLVKQATGAWALEAVQQVATRNNIESANADLDSERRIDDGKLDAEVIYAAGGNVLVIFNSSGRASDFIRQLSRRVLREAPGLTLLFAKQAFEGAKPDLFRAVQDAFSDLERQKSQRAFDAPLLGIGVTAACRSTGLPANALYSYESDKHQPLASSIVAKLGASKSSNQELRELFHDILLGDYDFPCDFDHLGRSKGEQSHIAVAHIDGNGFGQAMVRLGEHHKDDNRTYIDAMRKRSSSLEDAAHEALLEMIGTLQRAILVAKDKRGKEIRFIGKEAHAGHEDTLKLEKDGGAWFLPFRPLIFGGDDTTFVCDGRLGLSLATEYLALFADRAEQKLGQAGVMLPDERPSACAGIAIVKSHYPFSRAYHLADALCSSAKRFRAQEWKRTGQMPRSFLDWHFAISGLTGGLGDVRRREYGTQNGQLTLRPVSLDSLTADAAFDARTARSWEVVEHLLRHGFQSDVWTERRNKVKGLREALREGPDAVERFAVIYDIDELPALAKGDAAEHRKVGWLKDANGRYERCAYFDAIELADLHLPLKLWEEEKEIA